MQFIDNYPMSKLTTLQIGGPAKLFVKVSTEDELIKTIKYAIQNNLNHLIIGGGSNLLVNDQGVDDLVIKNEITGIASQGLASKGLALQVKSGTILQDLVDFTIQHGLTGLHKMTGIPGTVGGAIYGNAGAYGQTISDNIISVVVLSEAEGFQDLQTLSKEECDFGYRDSSFKLNNHIILEVTFQLENGNPQILKKEADEVLSKRLVKYPKGIKCPGSFFKNIVADTLPKEILDKIPPEKIVYGKLPAGTLLEMVGAKGDSEDGIYIASYHANLFINKDNGTAKAFYNLAKKYTLKVKEKFDIILQPEVQLINLPSLF